MFISHGVPDDAWRHGVLDECHSGIPSSPLISHIPYKTDKPPILVLQGEIVKQCEITA